VCCWVNRGTTAASDSESIRTSACLVSHLNTSRLSRSATPTLKALFPTIRPSMRLPKWGGGNQSLPSRGNTSFSCHRRNRHATALRADAFWPAMLYTQNGLPKLLTRSALVTVHLSSSPGRPRASRGLALRARGLSRYVAFQMDRNPRRFSGVLAGAPECHSILGCERSRSLRCGNRGNASARTVLGRRSRRRKRGRSVQLKRDARMANIGAFRVGSTNTYSRPMGAAHFLTKMLPRVSTEMSLHVLTYNFKRLMRILGAQEVIRAVRT